jgi:hypothetical protein
MVELRLRSGEIVSFDGRVLEVFPRAGPGGRLHVARLEVARAAEDDGGSTVTFGGADLRVRFARDEAPACARLLAAIAQAQRADAELDVPAPR